MIITRKGGAEPGQGKVYPDTGKEFREKKSFHVLVKPKFQSFH